MASPPTHPSEAGNPGIGTYFGGNIPQGGGLGTLNNNNKVSMEQQILSPTDSVIARTVLEATLSELHLMTETSPDIVGLSEPLNRYVGDAVSAIVQKQYQINMEYEEAIRAQEQHKQTAINKPIGAPTQEDKQIQQSLESNVKRLGESLKHVTKVLCGDISSESDIVNNLLKIQRHRSNLLGLLEGLIDDLSVDGGYGTLASAVENDVRQEEERLALIKRHTAITKDLTRVKKSIKDTDDSLKSLKAKAEGEMQALAKKLAEVKLTTKVAVAEAQRTTQGALDSKLREEGEDINSIFDKVEQLSLELEEEKLSSMKLLEHMSTRVKGMQGNIEALQSKFEEKQNNLNQRIDEMQDEISQLIAELLDLRKKDEANKETRKAWEEFSAFRSHAEKSLEEVREAKKHDGITAVIKSWREAILPPIREPPKGGKGKKAKTAKSSSSKSTRR